MAYLALSLLVLRVGADYSDHTTTPHDLALVANPLDRCSNLHVCLCALRQLLYDPPSPSIDGRKLQSHPVPDQHADEVSIRPVGDVRRDHLPSVQPHEIESTRKLLGDHACHVCHQFSAARLRPTTSPR